MVLVRVSGSRRSGPAEPLRRAMTLILPSLRSCHCAPGEARVRCQKQRPGFAGFALASPAAQRPSGQVFREKIEEGSQHNARHTKGLSG